MASLSDRIRAHVVRTVIAPARARGADTVRVKVGDVEREMELRQRAPAVCRALQKRSFLREQALRVTHVEGPPSGLSPRVVLTCALQEVTQPKQDWSWFDVMDRMMRGMWDDVGGGEAWLRKERSEWYGPNRPYAEVGALAAKLAAARAQRRRRRQATKRRTQRSAAK